MAFKGKKKTNEEKKKEIEDLTAGMTAQIESYFVSEEAMREHLAFMANFHNYSTRNMALIDNQFMGAQAVGSFNFWKSKGVSVKKGEKGIKILAPTPVQYFKRDGKDVQVSYATPQEKALIASKQIPTEKKLFFKVGHVFEYTQTNARELNMSVSEIFGKYHKDGELEDSKEMIAALHKVAKKLDFEILDEPPFELGTAKGAAFPNEKAIALNPRNTEFENVTTLIHELAHAKMHTPDVRKTLSTNEKEFQAEMVSYIVANRYGIDTEDFTLSYLSGWTKDADIKNKELLLNEVRNTASEFIDEIDSHFELVKEQELENEKANDAKSEILAIQEKHGLSSTEVDLNDENFASYLQENSPKEFLAYLSNKAIYEQELKLDGKFEAKEPMMHIHGITPEFQSFGKANNIDFYEYKRDQIAYTLVLPDDGKEMTVISGYYKSKDYIHPLHQLDKENMVEKDIYKSLEDNWHEVLISNDDEYITSKANQIRSEIERGELELSMPVNDRNSELGTVIYEANSPEKVLLVSTFGAEKEEEYLINPKDFTISKKDTETERSYNLSNILSEENVVELKSAIYLSENTSFLLSKTEMLDLKKEVSKSTSKDFSSNKPLLKEQGKGKDDIEYSR